MQGYPTFALDEVLNYFHLPYSTRALMYNHFSENPEMSDCDPAFFLLAEHMPLDTIEKFVTTSRRKAAKTLNGQVYTAKQVMEMGLPCPREYIESGNALINRNDMVGYLDCITRDLRETGSKGKLCNSNCKYYLSHIADWKLYKESSDESARKRLVERYTPVVEIIAKRVHERLPPSVDIDDLISTGNIGLMKAIENFEPEREVKFETYCTSRIKGEILDDIRRMDWVPRLVRARCKKIDRVKEYLRGQLGREPQDDELMQKMEISDKEYRRFEHDGKAKGTISLDLEQGDEDRNLFAESIANEHIPEPSQGIEREDIRDFFTKCTYLSQNEKLILTLYYYNSMTMKDIGLTLNLSESRISRMHSNIISRLNAKLWDKKEEICSWVEDV